MKTKFKRKPGAGRKLKLSESEQQEVLLSSLKVTELASHYKVALNTIYLIIRRERLRTMNIVIELVDEIVPEQERELCVFCNNPTAYWAVNENRPCCPLCSATNAAGDFIHAKFNY